MTKVVLTLLATLLAFHLAGSPVFAQTASDSATTSKIRERIEKIVEEKRDQIAGVLDDLSGNKRGFIGEVQRLSAETLTIRTNKGTRIISIPSNVAITKGNAATTLEQIAVGDWALVIGKLEDDEFVPERISVSSKSLRPFPQVSVLGSLSNISATSLTVTSRANGDQLVFTLPKTVILQDINGAPIKINQISSDMQALVVGQRPNEDTLNALVIRVLVANPPVVTPTPTPRTRSTTAPKPATSPSPKP